MKLLAAFTLSVIAWGAAAGERPGLKYSHFIAGGLQSSMMIEGDAVDRRSSGFVSRGHIHISPSYFLDAGYLSRRARLPAGDLTVDDRHVGLGMTHWAGRGLSVFGILGYANTKQSLSSARRAAGSRDGLYIGTGGQWRLTPWLSFGVDAHFSALRSAQRTAVRGGLRLMPLPPFGVELGVMASRLNNEVASDIDEQTAFVALRWELNDHD